MTLPAPLQDDQLRRLAQWTRWNGWCALAMGIVIALTIVGLPLAWMPIWQWWVLKQSADHLEAARRSGNPEDLRKALERSSFQFVLQVLYYLVMAVYFSAVIAILFALGFSPTVLEQLG